MRPNKPHIARMDEVVITRDGNTAIIRYHDAGVATTHLEIGPEVATLTEEEILDLHNQTIRRRYALAAQYHHVAIEVPQGKPQVEYSALSNQWIPRGAVVRAVIGTNEHNALILYIDDHELTLAEFGTLLSTYAGWGMRLIFVPDDELTTTPTIEVRDPRTKSTPPVR